jgi:hypothetical protein
MDPARGTIGAEGDGTGAWSAAALLVVLARMVALTLVASALPVALYVSQQIGLIRAVLSDLGPFTAVLLVLVVNVLAFLQVMLLWALWTTLRRDLRRLRATAGALTRLLPLGRTRPG